MGAAAGETGADDEPDDVSAVHERTGGMVAYAGVCPSGGGGVSGPPTPATDAAEADPDDAWRLEDVGAARCDGTAYVYSCGVEFVRFTWIVDGRPVMRLVPSSVIAHVLRVQKAAV